ncbi:cellulose biosynthesis cyclic di-GMP-binding regulatory protein BcsB [Mycobacterium sp. SMC-8]|uniref:cellulose biosynthesis cyclic di-GMP-binding regulatory protein BcsB n=1 Tax=Mycobacterium sp. SMC-8 TaxID=2857060 RepID=UPI0021B40CC5|nr:cellulose biosynthesis cyclic di-GMP-binding regulatory protein BcsB [Mycobacterium sp. SMC-8]UXA14953.1 cellulose biosynthesis cyclic di-GMP-binding regulatory protein BcsB [Mycobacterium sp. SMC-8]
MQPGSGSPKSHNIIGRALGALLSALLVMAFAAPGVAGAEPLNADPTGNGEVLLPWTALGLPPDVTLVGANVNQDFTLPVQSGFTPRRLRGLIHAPVDFGAGFVEITDRRGTVLGTVDLPAVTPAQAVVPFDVDISAAQISDSTLGLSFTAREAALPPEQRCGLGERVVLSDLSALFAGAEPAPTTIATFFPPVLQRLTIYAPIDADDAEQQAVLALTSAVARMYRPQTPALTVVSQPRGATPPASPQFTRSVVVENGDAGLEVVNPDRTDVFLMVTGRGEELTNQAALVADRLQSLAQAPSARVDQVGAAESADPDEMTFRQLGISGEREVLRTADLTVGVDRSALGDGRVESLQVHLLATHTPVADMDSASAMVSVNGQAVHSVALDRTGRLDTVFDVPGELLRQRINFEFGLTFSPRQLCSPTIAPMRFQLDPASTLTMRRGGPAPGGFGAVPSEFSPEFLVALDGGSPNQLNYAARVVADIAQRTGTALTPRVVDVKAAADAGTGALIVANSAAVQATSLRPPIGGEGSTVQVDVSRELRADIANGLASIQVFADTPRDRTVVLVTTTGAWSLVEPLFGYIDRQPDGWSSLDGDVIAAGAAGEVTNLAGTTDVAPSVAEKQTTVSVAWAAIGAGIVVVALGLSAALWWRRRSTAAPADPQP